MTKKGGGSTVRAEDVNHTPPQVNHPDMAMDTHDGVTNEEDYLFQSVSHQVLTQ